MFLLFFQHPRLAAGDCCRSVYVRFYYYPTHHSRILTIIRRHCARKKKRNRSWFMYTKHDAMRWSYDFELYESILAGSLNLDVISVVSNHSNLMHRSIYHVQTMPANRYLIYYIFIMNTLDQRFSPDIFSTVETPDEKNSNTKYFTRDVQFLMLY